MKTVFIHKASEALTIVPDAIQVMFVDDYYIVECSNSVGYFPRSTYYFMGIDFCNSL